MLCSPCDIFLTMGDLIMAINNLGNLAHFCTGLSFCFLCSQHVGSRFFFYRSCFCFCLFCFCPGLCLCLGSGSFKFPSLGLAAMAAAALAAASFLVWARFFCSRRACSTCLPRAVSAAASAFACAATPAASAAAAELPLLSLPPLSALVSA